MIAPMHPLVSVIIPTYNRAGYLNDTISSARAQTYQNLEILVLDDASSDGTKDVATAHQAEDDRIEYVRHDQNQGLVANWRYGIERARGEYFCILGDDDKLQPRFVEALLQPLRLDSSLTLAFCDHWVLDKEGNRQVRKSEKNSQKWRRNLLSEGKIEDFERVALINRSVFIGAVLFRSSMLNGAFIEDRVRSFIDMWMLYACAKRGPAYYIPQRLASCRWQEGGVSRSPEWRVYGYKGEVYFYLRLLEDEWLKPYHRILQVRLSQALVGLGTTYLLTGERRRARAVFNQALDTYPGLKPRIGYLLSYGGPLASASLSTIRSLRNFLLSPSQPPIYPEELFLDSERTGETPSSTEETPDVERVSA